MSSTRNALVRASGGFEFSGAYSIEVLNRSRNNKKGTSFGEHFFYPGLTRLEQSYTYNLSSNVTLGGYSTVDFGNGFSYITISSDIHPFYQGKPVRNPEIDTSSLASAATSTASAIAFEAIDIFNPIKKPGYIELIDLVWLFVKSRKSEDGYSDYPSTFLGSGSVFPNAGDIKNKSALFTDIFNLDDIFLVFHDYDRDEHWEIALDPQNGFNISSSSEKPQLYTITIKLIGLKQLDGKKKLTRPMVPSVRGLLNSASFAMGNLLNTLSSDLRTFTSLVSDFNNLKYYKDDFKKNLDSFNSSNRRSIDAMTGKAKKAREKSEKLRKLIYLVMSNPLPDATITTTVPPSEITTNTITDGTADLTEIATNETIHELDQFETAISTVELALTISGNSINQDTVSQFYTVQPGDSLPTIANKFLGDPSAIDELIELNNGNPIQPGDTIAVPGNTNFTGLGNPEIITPIPNLSNITPTQLENLVLGTDITSALDENLNSDLGIITGQDSLVETIEDILNNIPDTVPLHPEFSPLNIVGMPNELVLNLSIPRQILEAVQQEQGVKSAEIKDILIDNDTMGITISVVPITSDSPILISLKKRLESVIQ